MASGDLHIFDQFLEDEGLALHQLETNSFRCALVTASVTPTEATADPRWGAGGGTDLSANEVTPGGNYATGGLDIQGTFSLAGGTATFDGTNIAWAEVAGNPSTSRWGVIYNDTDAGKRCVGYIDLGGVIDMTIAPGLTITFSASGIFTVTSTAGT